MINKTLGIILLRTKSRRVKNKNFLKIKNKMMFQHILDEAIKTNIFNKIHLSTESKKKFNTLNKLSKKNNYKIVDVHPMRPKKLSYDQIPMFEVVRNILKHHNEYQNICLIYATGIMIKKKDILNMFKLFKKYSIKNPNCGISLQTMCQYPAPIEWAHSISKKKIIKPLNKKKLKITSDNFEKYYFDTGGVHFVNKKFFNSKKKKYYGYELPFEKSVDLDDMKDLKLLKKIVRNF